MTKKPSPIKSSATALLIFFLSTILMSLGLSAQAWQRDGTRISAQVTPENVTVRIVDLETHRTEVQAKALPLDASWVHGSNIQLEQPTALKLVHYGYGTVVTVPASATAPGGNSGWIHFAIPTPVLVEGARAKLLRVLLSFDGDAVIDRVDVWDGPYRILANPMSPPMGGSHVGLGDLAVFEFSDPPSIFFGVGISIHVRGCTFVDPPGCDHRTIQFAAAGADFTR